MSQITHQYYVESKSARKCPQFRHFGKFSDISNSSSVCTRMLHRKRYVNWQIRVVQKVLQFDPIFSFHPKFLGNVLFVVPLDYMFDVNNTYSVWVLCVMGWVTGYGQFLSLKSQFHYFRFMLLSKKRNCSSSILGTINLLVFRLYFVFHSIITQSHLWRHCIWLNMSCIRCHHFLDLVVLLFW